MKGRVIWWSKERGYGFIEYNNENIFAHLEHKDKELYSINENQEIEFTTEEKNSCTYLHNLKLLESKV